MAHIHEKIDFTATVYVVHDGRVLLRKHDKYGIWIGVGGHIELDEDANTAALREVKEEIGLDITLLPPPHWTPSITPKDGMKELIPPAFMNIHRITDTHQHHDLIFVGQSTSSEVIPENPSDEWKWCAKEDVLSNTEIAPRVKEYALYALSLILPG